MATYNYSPWYRAVEVSGIFGFFLFLGLMALESGKALTGPFADQAWWVLPGVILAGILAADFISGLFHFLADNFGDEDIPILGPNVIRPFREHHVDPRAMTRHDFVETNGNNCLICVWAMALAWAVVPATEQLWALCFLSFFTTLVWGVFLTNQIHKWSHTESCPALVRKLQDWHLILPPPHHDVHHTPPFDTYYCITTGWLNAPLHWVRFFPRLEAFLRWVTRKPRPENRNLPASARAPLERAAALK